MAEATKKKGDLNLVEEPKEPARCIAIAAKGIKTGADFASMMSAMMSDLAEQRIPATVANAMCNAGGKLLKVVEMQYRYGSDDAKAKKPLMLTE